VSDGARFVLVADAPKERSRTGQLVDVVRDRSGRSVLAEQLAHRPELTPARNLDHGR
jgi:hypothetical protein